MSHRIYKNGVSTKMGEYFGIFAPNHPRAQSGGYVQEHILVCEKALGGLLPVGAVVHHVNHQRRDNRNSNLVVCQDRGYHALIHARERAFEATGHADWRRCGYCKEWDAIKSMYHAPSKPTENYHAKCANDRKIALGRTSRHYREKRALAKVEQSNA